MSEYGVDLADLYTGRISMRRMAVLVSQLPAGSRYWQAVGGSPAFPDTVAAIHREGYLVRGAIHSLIGATVGKRVREPKPVEPPAEGWQQAALEKAEKQKRKAQRWKARNGGRRPRTR